MIRYIVVVVLLLWLLSFGCKVDPQTAIREKVPVDDILQESQDPETGEEEQQDKTKLLDPVVRDLMNKSSARVKSIKYVHFGPRDIGIELSVMGPLIRKEWSTRQKVSGSTFFLVVYINRTNRSAIAVCDDLHRCTEKDKPFMIDFGSQNVLTPLDLLGSIKHGKVQGYEVIDNRQTLKIGFLGKDGTAGVIWMEQTFGLPLKAQILTDTGTETYYFEQMQINSVKEADIVPSQDLILA